MGESSGKIVSFLLCKIQWNQLDIVKLLHFFLKYLHKCVSHEYMILPFHYKKKQMKINQKKYNNKYFLVDTIKEVY